MNVDKTINESRDILCNRLVAASVFWLPVLALIVSGFLNIGHVWRTVIWTSALATMGAGCIANALRCGRVRCYLTGPFFLVMAVVTILYGLGVAPLGEHAWNIIASTVLVGGLVLCYLPEVCSEDIGRGAALVDLEWGIKEGQTAAGRSLRGSEGDRLDVYGCMSRQNVTIAVTFRQGQTRRPESPNRA